MQVTLNFRAPDDSNTIEWTQNLMELFIARTVKLRVAVAPSKHGITGVPITVRTYVAFIEPALPLLAALDATRALAARLDDTVMVQIDRYRTTIHPDAGSMRPATIADFKEY